MQCVAGLSLGEYTALCAAGVFSFEDGLKLVKLRGEAMQEAASVGKQAMLSVVGLERDKLEKLCKEAQSKEGGSGVCTIANSLFPKGFSCAGTDKAIKHLEETAMKAGALKATVLKTGGAFHTSLMQPAAEKLNKALNDTFPNMKPPNRRIYMNVTGKPLEPGTDPKEIVDLLSKQLTSPVLWNPLMDRALKDGITTFYECGPQKQLKAMMKRIDQKAWNTTTNVEV
jgi:[acyl-carrier-protein] S-malonyltransferase